MFCLLPYIGGQKLGEISKSWQPKTLQDSRRDSQNLGGQKLVKILDEISKSWWPKTRRDSRQDLGSQNTRRESWQDFK